MEKHKSTRKQQVSSVITVPNLKTRLRFWQVNFTCPQASTLISFLFFLELPLSAATTKWIMVEAAGRRAPRSGMGRRIWKLFIWRNVKELNEMLKQEQRNEDSSPSIIHWIYDVGYLSTFQGPKLSLLTVFYVKGRKEARELTTGLYIVLFRTSLSLSLLELTIDKYDDINSRYLVLFNLVLEEYSRRNRRRKTNIVWTQN